MPGVREAGGSRLEGVPGSRGEGVRFNDRIIGKCGLCRKSVRRRDAVTVFKGDPTMIVFEFPAHLAPRLMTVHRECWSENRLQVIHDPGGRLDAETRRAIKMFDVAVGPVVIREEVPRMARKRKDEDFFDGYEPEGELPQFASKEEKAKLADKTSPFLIHRIRRGEGQFGAKFYVDIVSALIGDRTLTFTADGTVPSRDDMLEKMALWLEDGDGSRSIEAILVKQGRVYVIQRAPSEKPARQPKAKPKTKTAAKTKR